MRMLYSLFLCLFLMKSSIEAAEFLKSPLTLDERLQIFGQASSEKLPSFEYTSLEQLDVSGMRAFGKRPPTFLQYRLRVNGQSITISLKPNTEVIAPDCVVYKYAQNGSKTLHPCRKHDQQCLYTGKSDSHNDSWVAANVCNGLEGVIKISNTSMFISPLKTKKVATNGSNENVHVIYRYRGEKQICATSAHQADQPRTSHPSKRSATRRYIETSVFVDSSMVQFHGDRLEQYVQTVVNVAAERYQDESMSEDVRLTLKELHVLESYDVFNIGISYQAQKTLNNFCKWQTEFLKHKAVDASVLITRIDLEHPIGDHLATGLANPKGACDVNRRCAVIEDTGPNMGLTMAHEMGHLLGMRHDGDGNTCSHGIMSKTGSTGRDAFSWSHCSMESLRAFLRSSSSACLLNEPKGIAHNTRSIRPGTLYTAEQQCRLLLAEEAVSCQSYGQDVCESIACRESPGEMCRAYGFPLMDGTDCNNTRNWCMEGKCVPMDNSAPNPIDGGWSAWDMEFSTCTRTCGGGVKLKTRRCDNPHPQYGGNPCVGKSVEAAICNLQKCQFDYKATQCEEKNKKDIHGYKWEALNDLRGDSSCFMRCMTVLNTTTMTQTWPESYKDGTECTAETDEPFSRCIDGKCKSFGCDGHLDSGYQYDKCGVCNGTGDTCRNVSGSYSRNYASQVFTSVVVIPKGSTSVMIRQYNPYCFLSLAVAAQRILNQFLQGGSRTFMNNGVLIIYNRSPERIEIRGPLQEDIEIQVYRRYDYKIYKGVTPNITYSYYTPKITSAPTNYAWYKTNTQCSKECGTGISVPIVKCGEFNTPVKDHYCDIAKKPSEAPEACNTHLCPPEWRISDWSACSVNCGLGVRNRTVTCVQKDKEDYVPVQTEMCLGRERPVAVSNCSMGPCAEWRAGHWSSCSKTCGEGKKERFVACYRQGKDKVIKEEFCPRDQKPNAIEKCNFGKCRPDIFGAACKDSVPQCKQTHGDDICVGIWSGWAETHCMKSCGICSSFCEDDVVCSQYLKSGLNVCVKYTEWSKSHCPKMCGFCGCKDISQRPCNQYNHRYCKDPNYSGWMAINCRHYCQLC